MNFVGRATAPQSVSRPRDFLLSFHAQFGGSGTTACFPPEAHSLPTTQIPRHALARWWWRDHRGQLGRTKRAERLRQQLLAQLETLQPEQHPPLLPRRSSGELWGMTISAVERGVPRAVS